MPRWAIVAFLASSLGTGVPAAAQERIDVHLNLGVGIGN